MTKTSATGKVHVVIEKELTGVRDAAMPTLPLSGERMI